MNLLAEAFSAALASLNAHRLRSFLTTLGILIGTMAVIAVVSVRLVLLLIYGPELAP